MTKRKLKCPECNHEWEMNYLKWIFTALFHNFSFKIWKDKRLTKCPNCGKKSWVYSEKSK